MRLDVVIPAHNEEHRIDTTLRVYRSAFPSPDTRFVVALDDCSDGTHDRVAFQAAEDPRVQALPYPKLGKGGVIMESFRRSDAEILAFVDADCATPPKELIRLVSAVANGADVAIASRWHPASVLPGRRRRPAARRAASWVFARGVRRLFELPYSDTQCGAKVIRRYVGERVVPLLSSRDLVFDVDLLVAATRLGFRIVELPTIWIDRDGSRVDVGRDSRRMALSLLRLWLHHRVMPVPRQAARSQAPTPAIPHLPRPADGHRSTPEREVARVG